MDLYQQRVLDEKAELDKKITDLGRFIDTSKVYPALDGAEKSRLNFQYHAMQTYSGVLGERIVAFSKLKECPHAAPHVYCNGCKADPCPLGLS